MKLDSIEIFLVRIPLLKPFCFADAPLSSIDVVVTRLESGGISGWSEVFAGNEPTMTAAWSRGVFVCLRDSLLPRLMHAKQVETPEKIDEIFRPIRGNRHAKAAIDMAFLDLIGKKKSQPLHKLIGGKREIIEVGRTLDRYEKPDDFLQDLHKIVRDGYKRVTLKIRPGWDIEMLRAVRYDFPTLAIQLDVEEALSLDEHQETLNRFDDFFPTLIEQPLAASDFVGHAMLQEMIRTPICLDESLTTFYQADMAIDLRSGTFFCLKAGKMGGLTTAAKIAAAAAQAEIECYSGFEMGTSIGYRFSLALAALGDLAADYVPLSEWLTFDLGEPLEAELIDILKTVENSSLENPAAQRGCDIVEGEASSPTRLGYNRRAIRLWSEGGIGFEPDVKLIRQHAIATARVEV